MGFAPDELALNQGGILSERQRQYLRKVVRARRASRSLAIIVFLISLGVLWFVGYSLMQEEKASLTTKGQFDMIVGVWVLVGLVVAAIFAVFLWVDQRRAAKLRSGRVSMAEGTARLFTKEMKGARLYGMLAYYVEVGGVTFQMTYVSEYNTFEQGDRYRIYYAENPPTQTILSAEWLP